MPYSLFSPVPRGKSKLSVGTEVFAKNLIDADLLFGTQRKKLLEEKSVLIRAFFVKGGIDGLLGHPELERQLSRI